MRKIELIWREILTLSLEEKVTTFSQKDLALKFSLSTSTVFHALKKPRSIGAVEVGGRSFELVNFEKLLFLWATERNFKKDIVYQTWIDLPVYEIEGLMPADVIPTAYTAYRWRYKDAPADYAKVYLYSRDVASVVTRFPATTARENNLFILKLDSLLEKYEPTPPDVQIFVDLWNLSEWYAKEYQDALLVKMRAKLGL